MPIGSQNSSLQKGTGVKKCYKAKICFHVPFFHCSSAKKASFTKDLHLFEFNKCGIFWFLEIIPEKKLLTKVETENDVFFKQKAV